MKLKNLIINLYKKGFITAKPHPIIPFILGFVSLILLIIIYRMNDDFFNKFRLMLIILAIFIFIFSIWHFIVWKVINQNNFLKKFKN